MNENFTVAAAAATPTADFFIYDWPDLLLLYVVLLHILLLLFVVFPPVLKTFVKFRGISLLSMSQGLRTSVCFVDVCN